MATSCRKMSSPMARIPPDILIEIFQIACQPVDNGHSLRARQAATPLFIGSICRLWRDVAWSTPLLWSIIFLHISRKHHGTQIQLLGDWLTNAKSAPLSIKLSMEDERESVLCAFEAILRILVNRSDYWLTFHSCLPPPQLHDIFKNINFPMLTSVSLRSPQAASVSTTEVFLTAPKLVNVTLLGYNFPVVLPWGQVRSFRTGRIPVMGCLNVLQQSPNLQECHFEGVYTQHCIIPDYIQHHAQLKHLRVKLDESWSISLFDDITLPSLSNLDIRYNRTKRLHLSSITSLVFRSACNLERLSIKFPFDNVELIPCLEAIPSLTYLHLETPSGPDMGLTSHLAASLDPLSNSSRLLLPNLKYFEFKSRVLCHCRTIVNMLAHRWHLSDDGGIFQSSRVSKLKHTEILSIDPYHVTADVQEELRNLSKEGMSVRIESLVDD